MESATETELIARVRSKDRDALAEFIALRTPQLLAFITKRMSDGLKRKIEPADVLQELTVSCLNAVDSVEFGDRDPFSWLCQQAERRIIDAHRHHFGAQKRDAGREVGLRTPTGDGDDADGLADLIAASITSPSGKLSEAQRQMLVRVALDALGAEGRLAVQLHYFEGLPSKEIAGRLGKTDGAVRVLLSRSLSKLQDVLAQHGDCQTLLAAAKRRDVQQS